MTFKDLNLKTIYDENDQIFQDLFNPLLSNANIYKRGVGYFTSSWLEMCAEGLKQMGQKSGKITLVTSPFLSERDWDAFKIGVEAKKNKLLFEHLSEKVEAFKNDISKSKLVLLAWLIADGLLEIKIVIPKDKRGNFHDKFAIFEDDDGNKVALHGSLNDSKQASYNGESVSVFCSWIEGQKDFVAGHELRFDKSFMGNSDFYNVYDLPEAIRKKIISHKDNNVRPYEMPISERKSKLKIPSYIKLYDFQKNAIENWYQNNFRGLFEMATGTGKTITSLAAASKFVNDHKNTILIITVPFNHLIDQWKKEASLFGFIPIIAQSLNKHWRTNLRTKIQQVNRGFRYNLCIITTYATGSSDDFIKLIELTKVPVLYIADESHYLGAKKTSKLLHSKLQFRIGLSATPDRWFDENGSEQIRSFFEKTVINFPISEAIEKGYLTPYRFYPQTISLSDNEYEIYKQFTRKIINVQKSKKLQVSEKEDKVRQLLIQRSRVINNASEKLVKLSILLKKKIKSVGLKNIKHILVYSPQGKTNQIVMMLAELGIRAHEFTYNVSNKDRIKLIEQFENGDIQVLVAMKCLDEGVNIPATKEAYFLSSTTNPREFIQRRGRILRKYENKDEAIIHDFYTVPPISNLGEDAAVGILRKEIPRFAEFAEDAINKFEARQVVLPVIESFNLQHIIDLKPWDAYKKMQDEQRSENNYEFENK